AEDWGLSAGALPSDAQVAAVVREYAFSPRYVTGHMVWKDGGRAAQSKSASISSCALLCSLEGAGFDAASAEAAFGAPASKRLSISCWSTPSPSSAGPFRRSASPPGVAAASFAAMLSI